MRPQPLICVKDVEASSWWCQRLLGCESAHGGSNYERLVHSGKLVMQLHCWEEEHHHGRIGDPNDLPPGNGLLLWFEVDDFDAAIVRAEALGAEVILPRHRNPPEGTEARTIGRYGFVISMATKWCWRVQTVRQTPCDHPPPRAVRHDRGPVTMPEQPRKLSEIMKEMSETLLRNPGGVPSSEAAHVALFFANVAWNESVGLDHAREGYRKVWETIEAGPSSWSTTALGWPSLSP